MKYTCKLIADITTNDNASEYYGKYVTNYLPTYTNPETEDVKWRIFYVGKDPVNEAAGTGENNIYLIADHYIPRDELPAGYGTTTTFPNVGGASYTRTAYFTNLISLDAYKDGSSSIATDNPARNWLNLYWNALGTNSSANDSMKAIAYMMDTRVWNKFAVSGVTKYVIGGPTIELFADSWDAGSGSSTSIKTTLKASTTGYKFGSSSTIYGLSDTINLWVPVSQYNGNTSEYTEKESERMWIASPCSARSDSPLYVEYNGTVSGYMYYGTDYGFRPIVCLNSNVQLTTNDNGATYQIVK